MGDTGSLALGGLLGYIAVVEGFELLLVVMGTVFVIEALSVMIQVAYYKRTKPAGGGEGKRFFRMAPIHHHVQLGGWKETSIVRMAWLLTVLAGAVGSFLISQH